MSGSREKFPANVNIGFIGTNSNDKTLENIPQELKKNKQLIKRKISNNNHEKKMKKKKFKGGTITSIPKKKK